MRRGLKQRFREQKRCSKLENCAFFERVLWNSKGIPRSDPEHHCHLAAKATGATVLLSNHFEFDEAVKKNRMLTGRGNGPHPYEIGADWVARYFTVTENCTRATQIKLEQQSGQSR